MENQFREDGFIPRHGGYENLITFQKADIIFHGTKFFCNKYISKFDRTFDQMVQAARSGKMNILEGSEASATSKETEIKLTNVARASLKELREDYKDFIIFNKLTLWDKTHPYYNALTEKHLVLNPTYELYQKGIESDNPEVAANVLYSLTNITHFMLKQQLKRLEADFLKEGGLRERMTRARINYRRKEEVQLENKPITDKDSAISMEVVKKMVDWDKDRKVLEHWKWNTMKLITEGTYPLAGKYSCACSKHLETLREAGFEE